MGQLRFFRRVQLAPGLRLNLSKGGASVSLGVRGAHVTVGRTGIRRTVGLPGSGMFYTSHQGWHSGAHTGEHFSPAAGETQPRRNGCLAIFLIVLALVVLTVVGQIFGR
jgi:hypothetical protein